jgi:hypothetical protein
VLEMGMLGLTWRGLKTSLRFIACCRADSMSDACEGNDARSARM